jgi:geranylgeranyl reductase family protein
MIGRNSRELLFDVVVVGAGPAGSIAAYDCARMGLKTLMLEKYALPRDKPCGGAVMYRGIHILKGRIPKHLVEQKIYGLRFVLPNNGPAEFISDKMLGITVFRDRFDEFLARRAADAGVELQEESRVIHASVKDDYASVKLSDGREYKSKFLIGADGVNSVVSRSLGLRPVRNDPTKVGLGMESDFYVGEEGVMEACKGNPTVLEIAPIPESIGYGWIFPKREHLSIGVAGSAVHMHPLRPAFDRFRRMIEIKCKIKLNPTKRRTYFFGGDGLNSTNIKHRTILAGDAAGFVDPMMGEGIAYAMKSGAFAAEVIAQANELGRYDEEALSDYDALCQREFAASFAMAAWAGLRGQSFAEFMLPKVTGYKLSSDIMAMVARGEIGYSEIPQTVLRRLPRELPTIMRQLIITKMTSSS